MDGTLSKGKKIRKKAINKMLMAFNGELTDTTCELNRNGITRLLYSPDPAGSRIKIKAIAKHSTMFFIISSIFDFMHLH